MYFNMIFLFFILVIRNNHFLKRIRYKLEYQVHAFKILKKLFKLYIQYAINQSKQNLRILLISSWINKIHLVY
jgi:hypothetical protein